jgi:RimJ/RimL family protein N-acetyltransferase
VAAFVAENPDDRTAFDVHMAKVRTSPEVTTRAVTVDGRLVGSVASFVVDGDTEVTYWIDRSFWGPLFPCAASDNVRSLKVLLRAGFVIVGTEISFANGWNTEIGNRSCASTSLRRPRHPMCRAERGRLTDLGTSARRALPSTSRNSA